MRFYLICFLFFHPWGALAQSSCQQKLQSQTWPLDCFLALEFKPQKQKVFLYKKLDLWCLTFKKELASHPPPSALFAIKLPPKCKQLAWRVKKQYSQIEILEGRFFVD